MATIRNLNSFKFEKKIGYETGYKSLDDLINGIKEGTTIAIGSVPSMGKTKFMNSIISNMLVKYNLPILYVSLNSGAYNVVGNLSLSINKLSDDLIKIKDKVFKDSFNDFITKDYKLYVSDDCIFTSDLEELIKENRDIKVVVIDYVQLMKYNTFTNNQYDKNEVLNKVRILADRYNLVIFVLFQLSSDIDEREDKRPKLSDIITNREMENKLDIVMLLYRDDYYQYIPSESIDNNHVLEVTIAKNVYGLTGKIDLIYCKNTSSFMDYWQFKSDKFN